MSVQLLGRDGTTLAEFDPTFKAQRSSLRPMEATAWNSIGAKSGLVTGVAANAPLFSFRNLSSNPVVIRRLGVGFVTTTAFTTPQAVDFGVKVARAFTVSDSSGTAVSITGSNGKMRTSLSTPTSLDCRIATTAALTAGTRTLDTDYLAMAPGFSGAAGAGILTGAQDNLLKQDTNTYPLVLAQNEGFIIANITAFGAAGVGNLYVNLELAEATSF